jgi:RNA polymerase III RPC4.
MESDQYAPITLPFFSNKGNVESKITENSLMVVQLPDILPCQGTGNIGKLRVYKSGKMEMTIGGQVFQVFHGVQSTFYQEVAINSQDKLCVVGPVSSQIIIAPKLI